MNQADYEVYTGIVAKRNPLENFKENVGMAAFGRSREMCGRTEVCISCGQPAVDFKDELSRREYQISRLCQKCQDKIFVPEE